MVAQGGKVAEHRPSLVVVQFGKRFVSRHRFSDAAKGTILNGFTAAGAFARHGTAAKAYALYFVVDGMPEGMP
jgi:hypothetical protein